MTLSAPAQIASVPCILEIRGTLRVPLCPCLRERVEAVLTGGNRRILLDISNLLAIDAGGIGGLIQASNMTTADGGVLRIVGANERVHRVLEIVGLFELLARGVTLEHATRPSREFADRSIPHDP